jgi:hypothetical protein
MRMVRQVAGDLDHPPGLHSDDCREWCGDILGQGHVRQERGEELMHPQLDHVFQNVQVRQA